ncbi:enoyl-CoA hydratase-related protein [Mycolicibacterium sp. XJ1819]
MSTVTADVTDGVLHIQLDRPDKRNALNDEMFDDLVAATEAARANDDLAAVVLSGRGRSFCAGLDLSLHRDFAGEGASGQRPFADPRDPTSTGRRPGRGQRIVRALRDTPVPVIAAMHGHALGGGFQLALGADIRLVTADIQMGCLEIAFGMTVDMGASQLLPPLIGADRTLELLVTARRINGDEARAWGLASRVCDDPLAEALQLARAIAGRNRHAITETKRLVRLAAAVPLEVGMEEELSVMANNIGTPAQVRAARAHLAARRR